MKPFVVCYIFSYRTGDSAVEWSESVVNVGPQTDVTEAVMRFVELCPFVPLSDIICVAAVED
ncbi:hypothetical protein CCP3SC15_1820006 [Gammaproteobacteria bacterium]